MDRRRTSVSDAKLTLAPIRIANVLNESKAVARLTTALGGKLT